MLVVLYSMSTVCSVFKILVAIFDFTAFQLVSSSVGIGWRKLARELGVKNREIDKISTSTPDNQSAAEEVIVKISSLRLFD